MANVVVAWQSVLGGSATTAKLSVPPRLGVSACTAPLVASRHAAAIAVDLSPPSLVFGIDLAVVAADAWRYYRRGPRIARGLAC